MAFKHGRIAELTVATKALSTFCDTLESDIKVDTAETSAFLSLWKTYIAGMIGETVNFSGSWDPTVTTGPASVLTTNLGVIVACVMYPAGNNAGQGTSHTFNAIITDYKETSKTTDKVMFSCAMLVTGVDTIAQL